MESPPKRMTRARAAAKATEPALKTTRIVTAAARAKASVSNTNTRSAPAKRKTRADEADDDDADELDEELDLAKKSTCGRPRKATGTESQAPNLRTTARGRPAKKAATELQKEASAPTKGVRGRPRKKTEGEADALEKESSQATAKSLRSRTTTTKTATKASQLGVKKIVKFQEPDKENDGPLPSKEPSLPSGSMRSRPVRRAPVASSRSAKAAPKSTASSSSKPLSPKKVTQIPITRMDSSEDELAGGDTPLKRLQKQPTKPPSNVFISPRKPEAQVPSEDGEDNTLTINNAILNPPELGTTSLGSPARRLPVSPFKDSMKSPARKMGPVQLPTSMMKPRSVTADHDRTSPSKSLMQSAAKRPASPIKGLMFGSSSHTQQPRSPLKASALKSPAKRAMPGYRQGQASLEQTETESFEVTPRMKPIMSSSASSRRPSERLLDGANAQDDEDEEDVFTGPVGSLKFPGRMSAVLPRDTQLSAIEDHEMLREADHEATNSFEEPQAESASAGHHELLADLMVETQENLTDGQTPPASSTPAVAMGQAHSHSQHATVTPVNTVYQLRAKDLDPCLDMSWESEDDLSPTKDLNMQASPFLVSPSKSRRITMGLSSLADQLDSWSPAEPIAQQLNPEVEVIADAVESAEGILEQSCDQPEGVTESPGLASPAFFEQEMSTHVGSLEEPAPGARVGEDHVTDELVLEDVMITDEDVNLANEANEMSLKETVPEQSFSDDISEASQEYADENEVAVDPGLAQSSHLTFATPIRPAPRAFNTTTKVPLKPADYSTPSPVKKRSFSASRPAPRRPSGPTRNATVISYQPTRGDTTSEIQQRSADSVASTPAKSDLWSNIGTPARTPRRDVNPDMLRGAVVFVDVHTSEGADASGIFIDLLNQMGARCVKSWNWSSDGDGSSSKCGITHVVFKDGGKRTMERVRQAKGLVQCVGVTWVLDCERENQWLDESPYYIDRSFVPRGGARRRKSMEPKALANMNGTLVSNSNEKAASGRDTPKTPMNRRQSTVWMHTPSDQGETEKDDDDYEWSKFLMLTPVPKTPAPEVVAQYAADIPSTPSDGGIDSSPTQQDLLMRTCPPKSGKFRDIDAGVMGTCPPKSHTYEDLGAGILGRDKDEHVRMRLMAARRKSLQFAPKIGSPLARAWK